MNLFQPDKGYRYNSDTLLLYDFISTFTPKGEVLDVGCGCGILGLLLKRDFPSLKMHLLDIQEQNCTIACANAEQNGIEIASVICHDFLSIRFECKFDMIVSNPPFYHKGGVKNEDTSLFLSRHSSALPFDVLQKKSQKHLATVGIFVFVMTLNNSIILWQPYSLMGSTLKISVLFIQKRKKRHHWYLFVLEKTRNHFVKYIRHCLYILVKSLVNVFNLFSSDLKHRV